MLKVYKRGAATSTAVSRFLRSSSLFYQKCGDLDGAIVLLTAFERSLYL
ncbi:MULTISPECIES: hypothetical protein [Fischerella]|nr:MULTISPECIES: hypothetical protein [Fischerella]MBD2432016.1 hypothetical protein [Fischerella sp. FACHB-380]